MALFVLIGSDGKILSRTSGEGKRDYSNEIARRWRMEKRGILSRENWKSSPRSHRRIDAFLPGEDLFRKRETFHKRFKQQQNSHNQIGQQVRRDRYRYYRRFGHVRRRLRRPRSTNLRASSIPAAIYTLPTRKTMRSAGPPLKSGR